MEPAGVGGRFGYRFAIESRQADYVSLVVQNIILRVTMVAFFKLLLTQTSRIILILINNIIYEKKRTSVMKCAFYV